jgi:hypothetical protein
LRGRLDLASKTKVSGNSYFEVKISWVHTINGELQFRIFTVFIPTAGIMLATTHNKVRGCFAAKLDSNHSEPVTTTDVTTDATEIAGVDADADADADANANANANSNQMNSAGTSVVVTATAAPETDVA